MDIIRSGLSIGRARALLTTVALGTLLAGASCLDQAATPARVTSRASEPVSVSSSGEESAQELVGSSAPVPPPARPRARPARAPAAYAAPPPAANRPPPAAPPSPAASPRAYLGESADDALESGGKAGAGAAYGTVGLLAGGPAELAAAPGSAPAVPRLDPNARYATTYRPGGAALAAFDAALSRGSIPVAYRDLVGDFAARYAPPLAAPASGALAVAVDTERTAIAPAGGPLHLRVALRSAAAAPARARLSVHLVLDVSGSMEGKAIAHARAAAESLVRRLEPDDEFSLIVFSSSAQVLVPARPIGPRRAAVIARIGGVTADGGTNISAGLDLAYRQARGRAHGDVLGIVMVLSDGQANAGDTNPASLAHRSALAFQDGIQTSAFGLGDSFDAALMATIADRGAGGYYYLADATQIAPAR
jgi:Ca-activated chloride channel family protein